MAIDRPSGIDPKCYELAGYFLLDVPKRNRTKKMLHTLAGEIQTAVEDWFWTTFEAPEAPERITTTIKDQAGDEVPITVKMRRKDLPL